MKTILSTLAISVLSVVAVNAQTSYGIKTGVNLGKLSNHDEQGFNPSYFVTGFADISLSTQFSIQPGISLQGKGAKQIGRGYSYSQDATKDYKAELNTMSIEIPVNLVFYVPVGTGDVYLSTGPYIGYNIAGKVKEKGWAESASGERKRDVTFSGKNKMVNRIDAGVNFGLGYKFSNGLLLQAGYGLGLSNLNANKAGKKYSNRTMNFGIGYQF